MPATGIGKAKRDLKQTREATAEQAELLRELVAEQRRTNELLERLLDARA